MLNYVASTISKNCCFFSVDRYKPSKHRNHSDFPGGDLEPDRVTDRISLTTNRFYQGSVSIGDLDILLLIVHVLV